MEFREPTDAEPLLRQGHPGEAGNNASLADLRDAGTDLAAAADHAIAAALSGNSMEFLNHVRQTGGE